MTKLPENFELDRYGLHVRFLQALLTRMSHKSKNNNRMLTILKF